MADQSRILVVEDQSSWQAIYKTALQDLGLVTIVGDVATALDAIYMRFYHVAIVDVHLGEADQDNLGGLRVLEKIWELDEGTEAIVVTGYATDMFAQFRKLRMFGLEDKPWLTPEDLLRQSRSAAFLKNYYSKEDGIQAIADKVRQVIPAVLRPATKEDGRILPLACSEAGRRWRCSGICEQGRWWNCDRFWESCAVLFIHGSSRAPIQNASWIKRSSPALSCRAGAGPWVRPCSFGSVAGTTGIYSWI